MRTSQETSMGSSPCPTEESPIARPSRNGSLLGFFVDTSEQDRVTVGWQESECPVIARTNNNRRISREESLKAKNSPSADGNTSPGCPLNRVQVIDGNGRGDSRRVSSPGDGNSISGSARRRASTMHNRLYGITSTGFPPVEFNNEDAPREPRGDSCPLFVGATDKNEALILRCGKTRTGSVKLRRYFVVPTGKGQCIGIVARFAGFGGRLYVATHA